MQRLFHLTGVVWLALFLLISSAGPGLASGSLDNSLPEYEKPPPENPEVDEVIIVGPDGKVTIRVNNLPGTTTEPKNPTVPQTDPDPTSNQPSTTPPSQSPENGNQPGNGQKPPSELGDL